MGGKEKGGGRRSGRIHHKKRGGAFKKGGRQLKKKQGRGGKEKNSPAKGKETALAKKLSQGNPERPICQKGQIQRGSGRRDVTKAKEIYRR